MGGVDKEDAASTGSAGETAKPLPADVMKRVEALEDLKKEYLEQHKTYITERAALELKFQKLYADINAKRTAIVKGEVDPAAGVEGGNKGIPGFWLQVFHNSATVGNFVEEHDEDALETLWDVTWEYLENCGGFKIVFHFSENEFFTNSTLTKSFVIPDMIGNAEGHEAGVQKIEGCDIDWKEGKDLTKTTVKKTVKQKGKKKTVTREEPRPSFFRFFETPDMEAEAENPEEQYAIVEQINAEIDVGMLLKTRVIPNAIDWFTGEAEEDDDEEDEDYDEAEEDDEDEDDEEEEDEEEEEEEEAPKKGKGGKGGAKGGKGGKLSKEEEAAAMAALAASFKKAGVEGGKPGKDGEQPECKQQ